MFFFKYNVQTSGGPPSYAGDAVQLIGVANLAAIITISQYFAGWVFSVISVLLLRFHLAKYFVLLDFNFPVPKNCCARFFLTYLGLVLD